MALSTDGPPWASVDPSQAKASVSGTVQLSYGSVLGFFWYYWRTEEISACCGNTADKADFILLHFLCCPEGKIIIMSQLESFPRGKPWYHAPLVHTLNSLIGLIAVISLYNCVITRPDSGQKKLRYSCHEIPAPHIIM